MAGLKNISMSDLLSSPIGNSASYLTPLDRDKLSKIPPDTELIPVTTRARDSSSTKKLLQAASMRDHTISGDHDARYLLKMKCGLWCWLILSP